ncbi:hypothetical protein VNO80_18763 [Phaseolus coccineus]|uniref:Uncharacterized protein n=1 Tax=Phaseolus coccineus TaxID=3886 RepID=A0AAN9ML00_PHACN
MYIRTRFSLDLLSLRQHGMAWHGMALAPKGSKDFMFAPRALRPPLLPLTAPTRRLTGHDRNQRPFAVHTHSSIHVSLCFFKKCNLT